MKTKRLAIIGGGPAALLTFKRLVESAPSGSVIEIFEQSDALGKGMPYGKLGASDEHVTNVSADELPVFDESLDDWVNSQPDEVLHKFDITRGDFHQKEVLPRLLFGEYLRAQFERLLLKAKAHGLETTVHYSTRIHDVYDNVDRKVVQIEDANKSAHEFDHVVMCMGHRWPIKHEAQVEGYFDSPYPPSKLAKKLDHLVVIRGSSLTAFDAIRTTSRANGRYQWQGSKLTYICNEHSPNFRIAMHSRNGLLPCVRVHMEEPHTAGEPIVSGDEIEENIRANDGFLQLDFLFERGFKQPLKEAKPEYYEQIKELSLEEFVEKTLALREAIEPFALFRKEYAEAQKSIEKERPVYWKETLAALSFAMNYPAKHLSAEDMIRLRKCLLPLISVVIAFVPQSSCEELMALSDAGRLEIIADGGEGGSAEVKDNGSIVYSWEEDGGAKKSVECKTFIDCVGQKQFSIEEFPFESLLKEGSIAPATMEFRDKKVAQKILRSDQDLVSEIIEQDGRYFLKVPGVAISDNFQLVDAHGNASDRLFLMAVPYMGGFNPDYSGLDFCERASQLVVDAIFASGAR